MGNKPSKIISPTFPPGCLLETLKPLRLMPYLYIPKLIGLYTKKWPMNPLNNNLKRLPTSRPTVRLSNFYHLTGKCKSFYPAMLNSVPPASHAVCFFAAVLPPTMAKPAWNRITPPYPVPSVNASFLSAIWSLPAFLLWVPQSWKTLLITRGGGSSPQPSLPVQAWAGGAEKCSCLFHVWKNGWMVRPRGCDSVLKSCSTSPLCPSCYCICSKFPLWL